MKYNQNYPYSITDMSVHNRRGDKYVIIVAAIAALLVLGGMMFTPRHTEECYGVPSASDHMDAGDRADLPSDSREQKAAPRRKST
jgi:hypothetical protein